MLGWPVLLVSVWLVCANGVVISFGRSETEKWEDHVSSVLQKRVTKFTLDMDKAIDRFRSKAIRNGDTSNIILSPLNLVQTLSVIHLSALDETLHQFSDVIGLRNKLRIEEKSKRSHEIFGRMIRNVCAHQINSRKPLITTSTAVFGQTDYPMRPRFKSVIRKIYNATIMEQDLDYQPLRSMEHINQWLNERMLLGKNGNIFPQIISCDSDAIIASTLNFNGTRHVFVPRSLITKAPFTITSDESVMVDMVQTYGYGSFYKDEELGLEIIGLPYTPCSMIPEDDKYVLKCGTTMFFMMPLSKDPGSLIRMKSRLTPEIIEDLLDKLKNTEIFYQIPLMNLSSTLNLKRELVSMGLSSLFNHTKSSPGLLSENFKDSSYDSVDFKFPDLDCIDFQPNMEQSRPLGLKEMRENMMYPKELMNPGNFFTHFLHKVNVDFTETGTIAGSATVAARLRRPDNESDSSDLRNNTKSTVSGIYDPSWTNGGIMNITINRPFLFFIKHDPTNLMLLWGTINNPTSN